MKFVNFYEYIKKNANASFAGENRLRKERMRVFEHFFLTTFSDEIKKVMSPAL